MRMHRHIPLKFTRNAEKMLFNKNQANSHRATVHKINKSKTDFILPIANLHKKLFNAKIKEIESKIR